MGLVRCFTKHGVISFAAQGGRIFDIPGQENRLS